MWNVSTWPEPIRRRRTHNNLLKMHDHPKVLLPLLLLLGLTVSATRSRTKIENLWSSLDPSSVVVAVSLAAWNFFLHSRHFTCLLLGPFTSLSIYSYLDTIKRAKWGPATKSTDDDGNGTSQRNEKHREWKKERKKIESKEKLSVIGEQQQYNATKTQHSQNPRDMELWWWPMEAAAVCTKRNYPPRIGE